MGPHTVTPLPQVPSAVPRHKLLLIALPGLTFLSAAYWLPVGGHGALALDIVLRVLLPLATIWYLWRLGVSGRALGLLRPRGTAVNFTGAVCYSLLIYISGWALYNALISLGLAAPIEPQEVPYVELGMAASLYFAVSAPLSEEAMFRGVLGAAFLDTNAVRNRVAFICVSATLFTLAHVEFGFAGALYLLYVAVLSAILYIFTRSIWPLVVGHLTNNLLWLVWVTERAAIA